MTAAFLWLFYLHPGESLEAALLGVDIWWHVLLPALLPFLVMAEILLGFGVVHFIGTLVDPLMRPLFRVPGIGGFVMAMGFASGYPVAAKLTAQLHSQGLLSRLESTRLVAFCTTSDPIFLIGAVSVGFFGRPELALALAVAHYVGALLVGIGMRYAGNSDKSQPHLPDNPQVASRARQVRASLVRRAFRAMQEAKAADGRLFGQLLQDALKSALNLILIIGGLVVFFSVVIALLKQAGLVGLMIDSLGWLFRLAGIPLALSPAVVNGLFEVTLGAKSAGAAAADSGLLAAASLTAFILSWGGFSVHAQVASLLHGTGVAYRTFLWARLAHGILAALLLLLLWPLFGLVSG
ncbi:sporulation integral membrane protein YlbJ [Xylanibacillus composti]|nr:sporulation integral membrane protein YlbJ [Xylanibacillus composti]